MVGPWCVIPLFAQGGGTGRTWWTALMTTIPLLWGGHATWRMWVVTKLLPTHQSFLSYFHGLSGPHVITRSIMWTGLELLICVISLVSGDTAPIYGFSQSPPGLLTLVWPLSSSAVLGSNFISVYLIFLIWKWYANNSYLVGMDNKWNNLWRALSPGAGTHLSQLLPCLFSGVLWSFVLIGVSLTYSEIMYFSRW